MPFYQLPSGASPVLAGTAPPTGGIGVNGDLFIDTANKFLYGPKASGSWPSGIDLSNGPTGVQGQTGPTGATGATGVTGGIAFTVGPTAPTAPDLTVAGAVWLDQNTGRYFVRYQTQFIEIGVQGERGPTGVTGTFPFVATGPTAPNVTAAGSVWLDTDTGKYFVRYDSQFIEIGVQGERGPTGAVGATGAQSNVAGPTGPAGGPTGPTGNTGPTSTTPGPTGSAGSFSDAQSINPRVTGYTLELTDAGRLLTFDATGTIQVVVPDHSSVAFPTGTHVDIARLGSGGVQVTGAAGVTINATPGAILRAQYSAATMVLYSGNTWLVVGDLTS